MRITSPAPTIVLIVVWLAATAWMRPLMLPDEGRYVGVAWEMLQSGDWLTPTLNGLPFFHKPPLFYWITATSMAVFGSHEWAERVAAIAGASVGAVSLYLFLRRWCSVRAARLGLLALLVQPLFYVGAQFANLDMLVAGCIAATVLLAAHAGLSVERQLPFHRALAAAYAMAALGLLAKGLIGAVLPALVIAAWLLLRRRWRTLVSLLWWPGLLIFLLLAAPWFIAMQLRFPGFLDYFFVVQQFRRFAAGGFNNVEPLWFYPVLLLLFFLPWVNCLWRSVRNAGVSGADGRAVRALMLAWLLVVLVFFSLPQSKLVGYILPAVVPMAALVADGFLQLPKPSRTDRAVWWGAAAVSAAVSIGVVITLAVLPHDFTRELALALRKEMAPGDAVFMAGKYFYDVPVYAHLTQPVHVVEDWDAADVDLHDNERKELADAGRFSPSAASRVLVEPSAFAATVCMARVSWVLGAPRLVARYPFLAVASVARANRESTLWRVDLSVPAVARALDCQLVEQSGPTAERARTVTRGRFRSRA